MNIKKIIIPFVALLIFFGLVIVVMAQTEVGNNVVVNSDLRVDGHVGIGDNPHNSWLFSVVRDTGNSGPRIRGTNVNGHGAFIASSGGNYILRLRNEDTGVNAFDFNANGSMVAQGDVRAPIFYDSQNTNYYINPSASNISARFNGSVGIGPDSSPTSNRRVDLTGPGSRKLDMRSTTNSQVFFDLVGGGSHWLFGADLSEGYFMIGEDNSDPALTISETNGWVGLGMQADQRRLQLPNISNSNGRARANAWNTYSSIRYKENITPLSTEEAIEKIMNLNPVSFNWKEEHGGSHDIGFIAEEVGTIIPEAVEWDEDGEYADGLNVGPIISNLTKVVQNHQSRIEGINVQLIELEN